MHSPYYPLNSPARPDIAAKRVTVMQQSHHGARRRARPAQLHGGCCHWWMLPAQLASGGDDGSVRLWGVEQQLMLAMRLLPRGVGSLAYSSDGLRG